MNAKANADSDKHSPFSEGFGSANLVLATLTVCVVVLRTEHVVQAETAVLALSEPVEELEPESSADVGVKDVVHVDEDEDAADNQKDRPLELAAVWTRQPLGVVGIQALVELRLRLGQVHYHVGCQCSD